VAGRVVLACACVALTASCGHKDSGGGSAGSAGSGSAQVGEATPPARASCPATALAPSPLPGVEPAHRTLDYWLAHTAELDDVLLEVDRIRDMNASLAVPRGNDWHGENDLGAPIDRDRLVKDLDERLTTLTKKLTAGDYVEPDGKPVGTADVAAFAPALATGIELTPALHVTLDALPLRCGPRVAALYAKPAAGAALDTRLDRNSCSTAHPQEVVQILATWPNKLRLVRTRYATGWIGADARLSPPIPDALRDAYLRGPRGEADDDVAPQPGGHAAQCPGGTLLPLVAGTPPRVRVASATGFHEVAADDRVQPTRRPLTRRALLEQAFRFLDTPYGWGGGGSAGGHDCSGFIMDLFAAFDLHMPRHSSWQAHAGTFTIDLTKVTEPAERQRLIDAAARKGIVLLGFSGHIMLYLGRNERGTPMVMHALAEYAAPCPGGGETIRQIDRIVVSDLELGRGSSRRSLFERITSATVIGKPPGVELAGAAELRPAAPIALPAAKTCRDSEDIALFASPRRPNAKQPVRVIATTSRDPGSAELVLFDPKGQRVTPSSVVQLAGGPPWSVVATVDAPVAGTWTAVLGDGARIDACKRVAVADRPPGRASDGEPTAPVWDVQRAWGRATEDLYATFVQRLFDFPVDQDLTWPDLHTLLRDRSRNILFDHLQRGEEDTLKLQPDCADLPYVLRAYFAWKLGLPFAYHACTRGTANRAPSCKPAYSTNLMLRDFVDDKLDELDAAPATDPATPPVPPEETDGIEEPTVGDVPAFALFWARHVSRTVHASTGRTLPDDDVSDYYPVPLARESLAPGTVYIDPFGHVMVVAAWVPQTATSYGVLLAADAQPDGTVGRKRFWRGNFLFTPDTRVSGAGFKSFRPAVYQKATQTITLMTNAELARSRVFSKFSRQQYEGTVDTFHDTVEALINPRPLEASAALAQLVDSLHSQATLRVVSVNNGEAWAAAHPHDVVPMPDGADIFLTAGPWEDFATPSRDFRLLIAIDTVLAFPASVRRAPARFGLQPGAALDAAVVRIEHDLDAALRAKTVTYVRSDGKSQTITLRDLVDRRTGFEMAYNPNDCVELRWAAPDGSPEAGSCQRHAPTAQLAKMTDARAWFRDRQRPAR
jgi:cell wall-associated NlpC family hydrolase